MDVSLRRTFPVADQRAGAREWDAPVPADAGPSAGGEEGGSKPRKRLVEVMPASPKQQGNVRRRGERQEEKDFPFGGVKPPPDHPTGGLTSLAGGGGR